MRTFTSILLLVVMFFFSCKEDTINPAEFGALAGEVLIDGNTDPVDNARVTTSPITSTTFTDDLGRFSYDNVAAGTYSVRVEKDGFITALENVTIIADRTTSVAVAIKPDTLENTLPLPPSLPMPMDEASNISISPILSWSSSDQDEGEVLKYDVRLFTADHMFDELIAVDLTDTFVELMDLQYDNTYLWQVIVKDRSGEAVNGPVWEFTTEESPDFRFLYTREVNGNYHIFTSDGMGVENQLTTDNFNNWRPRFSPLRNRIAFISNRNLEPQIYLMDRNGDNITQVTNIAIAGVNNLDLNFAWSPDGTRLLYMNNSQLFLINTDGTGLRKLADAPAGMTFTTCDWNVLGDQILVRVTGADIYNSSIFLLDTDGNYVQQVFNNIPGRTGGPMFSIDGSRALYTHDVSGFEAPDGRQLDSRIFIKELGSQVASDLSQEKPDGTNDLDARFSPDGSKIIFVNTNNDGISPKHIYIMDLNGENRTLLFEDAEMPEWK